MAVAIFWYYLAEVYPEYKTIRLLIPGDDVPVMSTRLNKYKIVAEVHILPADLHEILPITEPASGPCKNF
jgi:folate-binding Fe-S cluster repair protein YgfZ